MFRANREKLTSRFDSILRANLNFWQMHLKALMKFATILTLTVFMGTVLVNSGFSQTDLNEQVAKTETQAVVQSLVDKQIAGEKFLIEQSKINGLIPPEGGGACPSAAAFITYQAMRGVAGHDLDRDPFQTIVAAFANDRTLLNGRLTNTQFVHLLEFYKSKLEGVDCEIEVVSAPNSRHRTSEPSWQKEDELDLSCKHNELRVLSYTVTKDEGEVLGRHFVVLNEITGNQISVVDPNAITKNYKYTIDRQTIDGDRVFLRYPADLPQRPYTNELNTIFKVAIKSPSVLDRLTPTESTSVETVKKAFDLLAEKLERESKLRSPRDWRLEGAKFGLPALDLPSEFGGANWPATKMIEIFRHAGRYDLNLRDVVGGAHTRVLLNSKSEATRDIVQAMADGRGYMAIAITEPGSGSDFTSMQATSHKVSGGYVLNGEKRFNARLKQATHVVVFTKSNTGNDGRINTFVLPVETKGLQVKEFGAHGLIGNSYGGLKMTNVFVHDSQRIGDEDAGYHIFNKHFRYWRLMQAASAIGTAEKGLEMMSERLKTRKVNGRPIGRFTHLQQPLGQYTTELKMAYALAAQAAELIDRGDTKEADKLICGLKAEAIESALEAVDAAARAFGGEGYSDLVDIGDRLSDLNGLRIADGTTDVMRSAVVAKTYGKEFWEMAIEPKSEAKKLDNK